jgi:hypothetical protein
MGVTVSADDSQTDDSQTADSQTKDGGQTKP